MEGWMDGCGVCACVCVRHIEIYINRWMVDGWMNRQIDRHKSRHVHTFNMWTHDDFAI